MSAPSLDILMYHSISEADGPTSISPATFRSQMNAIADAQVPVVSMDEYLAARRGEQELPPYSIVITFDDGFRDFAQSAWPIMKKLGFKPIVYLPTDNLGREEDWVGGGTPPRQLMSWHEVKQLAADGVLFGSHTVSHANLNELLPEALDLELTISRQEIEDQLGQRPLHFAPPYGLSNGRVREAIGKQYETAVGTTLGSTVLESDVFDLPRLEMYYFNDLKRWKDHLAGRGAVYLRARKFARRVRRTVLDPWQ